jgi:plastocyanin
VLRRSLCALLLASTLTALASCSGSDDAPTATATTVVPIDTGQKDRFDFTPTITITDAGFRPAEAVATIGQTLTFVNQTSRPQTITFTNGSPEIGGAQTIGPIAPGQQMSWPRPLSTAISLRYESDALPGQSGQVQIDKGIDNL